MANVTRKGRELAGKLGPSIGWTRHILETCSLIARHATTYHRIQEGVCNGHPAMDNPGIPIEQANTVRARYEAWLEKRDAQLEKRITELVNDLPHTDEGPIGVRFGGDPRGATVTLLMPDGNTDNWEHDGIVVN